MSKTSPPRRRPQRRPQRLCLPQQPTPAAPTRLYQLSDADLLIQERQRVYYRHQRGGTFIEDEDEQPRPCKLEPGHLILPLPVSPSFTQVTTPERSIDDGEQHNVSSAESW